MDDFRIIASSADPTNISETISKPVAVDKLHRIRELCTERVIKKLDELYPAKQLYCWALSNATNYINSYPTIRPNDYILIKPNKQKGNGDKYYKWLGKVKYTTELCPGAGEILWGDENWTRLLFLDELEKIEIPARLLSIKFNYKENLKHQGTYICSMGDVKGTHAFKTRDEFLAFCRKPQSNQLNSITSIETSAPTPAPTVIIKKKLLLDDELTSLCKKIENLKNSSNNYSERDCEALVKDFLEYSGYIFSSDFKYRQGFVDLGILKDGKCLAVIEVKKEQSPEKLKMLASMQAFAYAYEHGARFVIITNGDTYFVYDRTLPGLHADDHFIGKVTLTNIVEQNDLDIIKYLHKDNLMQQ